MRLDKKKRGFQLPHVIIILMCIMLAVTVMSFLIPSGEFVRDANGAVDPTQFSYVENDNPITFFDFFYDIPHGIVESSRLWSSPVCSMSSSRPEPFPPPSSGSLLRPGARRSLWFWA